MQDTAVEEKGRQDERLGNAPLGRLMVSMALPAVAAQLINMLYNIVDRIYIGHIPEIGSMALTGVGICMPAVMVMNSFAQLVGMGGAPRMSFFMGQGKKEEAQRTLGSCALLLGIFGIVLTGVFRFFLIL